MSLFFDSPAHDEVFSPSNSPRPTKRRVFSQMSPNVNKMFPKKSILSPNFNVVTKDWSENLNSLTGIPTNNSQSSQTSRNGSPTRKLRRTNTADRFIPSRQGTSGKLSTEEIIPAPNDSPDTHIRAQTSKYYKNTVAEACGLEMHSRILQFQPAPPERKTPINLFNDITTNNGSNFLANPFKTIKPSIAAARAKKVPTAPERVLDAPGLTDDFYLNLIAWSNFNLLAIALEDSCYVWNASSGSVGLLCQCESLITSIRWSEEGSYISIGRTDGLIEVWDIETNMKLRTMKGHLTRVGSQGWCQHLLTSGSRSGEIFHHDVRIAKQIVGELKNHIAEVCGIEWRPDGNQLATGGNDNIVNIWDPRATQPTYTKTIHTAAIKALSWCPTQLSLLATGGGSSDRNIHFWNTTTGARVNTIEAGSQISSLRWGFANGTGREIAATHGYPDNAISVYAYPSLQKTGEIVNAHDSRILHSALSPDGTTLATVAGDENLKFWKIFDARQIKKTESSLTDDKEMRKVMTIR